jgi:hypothetical protein
MSIASRSMLRRGTIKPQVVSPTVTVDLAAYTAGDNMGGKLTLAGVSRVGAGPVVLEEVKLTDFDNQKPVLEIVVFEADPAAATLTNNAAQVLTAPDALKVAGRIAVAAGDWVTVGGVGIATVRNIGMLCNPALSNTLYAALMVTGTPDMVTTTAIGLDFVFYPAS